MFNSEKMEEYRQLQVKKDTPALKRSIDEIEEEYEDPEIAMLEKLLAEKRDKYKNLQDEM